jgi:hypothetical protein
MRLNSILDAIKYIDCDNCAIVNSDIILNKKISKSVSDGILIGTRWEISDDKNKKPYPFSYGYDLFIFNRKVMNLFYNSNYVIGMPWWDFWIPMISIKSGIKVYHIKNHLISHRTHPINYDKDVFISFGEYLYQDIMLNLLKNPVIDTIDNFCTVVKNYIEKSQINIKVK